MTTFITHYFHLYPVTTQAVTQCHISTPNIVSKYFSSIHHHCYHHHHHHHNHPNQPMKEQTSLLCLFQYIIFNSALKPTVLFQLSSCPHVINLSLCLSIPSTKVANWVVFVLKDWIIFFFSFLTSTIQTPLNHKKNNFKRLFTHSITLGQKL